MSAHLLLLLLLLPIRATQSKSVEWRPIETTDLHWFKRGDAYTLVLEGLISDAERDVRLRIKVPGRPDFTLSVPGGVVKLTDGSLDQKVIADNLLKSNYLYLAPKLRDSLGRPMLFVFGEALGSDPGSLHVLSMDKTGYPVNVFKSDTFELAALSDLDGDGKSEITGLHCLGQTGGCRCCSTYDPYSVYRLPRSGVGRATFSLALSKAYNLKHYYGWAGRDCREDIVVVTCAPKGKPRIMSLKKAERLYKD
ncbi:MAG: hypothetical protein ND895_01850 [Pyrinomonadaceae bacterium]|nr:hypothetical protein [Pyrinomonadaceae bacterium]